MIIPPVWPRAADSADRVMPDPRGLPADQGAGASNDHPDATTDVTSGREAADFALRTIPGRLRALREVDESGRAVRWILTRGGNLQHAVASIAPIGREARTRCGLQVAPYEHRAARSSQPRCTTCLERIGA